MFLFKISVYLSVFAFSSAVDIEALQTAIQNAVVDFPDPVSVEPITDKWQMSYNVNGTYSVTGLKIAGLSKIYLADISWDDPLLQYKFDAPTLIVNIGTLDFVASIYGVKVDAVFSGLITITGSTVNGTLVLDTATRTVSSSVANFNLGHVQPQLTAKIAKVDISPLLNIIIGETIPAIVDNIFDQIDELVAAIVAKRVTVYLQGH